MDYDLVAILAVMALIVLCLAPDIKEILLIISFCINAMSLTKGIKTAHKKRNYPSEPSKKEPFSIQYYPQHIVQGPYPPVDNYQYIFNNYPGKIDYEESPPIEYGGGNDRIAKLNIERQGTDYVRQIKGEMGRINMMRQYVNNDCDSDEFKQWWSRYDY